MNRVTELNGVQLVLSLNTESKAWEVWAAGLGEVFPDRLAAVAHVRHLGRALGWKIPADF